MTPRGRIARGHLIHITNDSETHRRTCPGPPNFPPPTTPFAASNALGAPTPYSVPSKVLTCLVGPSLRRRHTPRASAHDRHPAVPLPSPRPHRRRRHGRGL